MQESLFQTKEQTAAQIALMLEFMKRTAFSKKHGDALYYVRGTEVHVGDEENPIGKELGAVNSVGGVLAKLGADGSFGLPKFVVQVTKDG